jgi:hypothetical protein
MPSKVYIQSNSKQYFCAKISAFSIQKLSSEPIDIQILNLEDYPQLTKHQGSKYVRKDLEETWENDTLQSFTPLRFLPPQLQRYQGRALVIDPDVFALTDVQELLKMEMQGKSICCNYDIGEKGRVYKTSVMLLDCEKLTHWKWDEKIEALFSKEINYRKWMSLFYEKEEDIGFLEEEWNHMDKLSSESKLIHFTKKVTQPWKTGLPIDFIPDKVPPKWGVLPRKFTVGLKSLVLGGFWREKATRVYLPNPHKEQAEVFWQLAGEALKAGVFTIDEAKAEIRSQNIRGDFLEIVQRYVN